jgi:Cu(I)/Ag(I) efflux system periplasmic protein CusF
MKQIISISLLFAALVNAGIAMAADPAKAMNLSEMSDINTVSAKTHKASGVVNKIDMQHSTINLTHGPIKSLGWSGMTMDFMVKETSLLKSVKPGQKVSFEVMKEESGKYYISSITSLK